MSYFRHETQNQIQYQVVWPKKCRSKTMGIENLPIWFKLYQETAIRNGIFLDNMSYFETVLTTRAADTLSPAEVFLLVAKQNAVPLAAMF